jgi:hypothetical protein
MVSNTVSVVVDTVDILELVVVLMEMFANF